MRGRISTPIGDDDWAAAVRHRRRPIAQFLAWAAKREASNSLRLANRGDIARVRRITDAFGKPWWAAVVYTCFDSEIGTRAVSNAFHDPVGPDEAERRLSEIELPPGSVQGHRIQPAHKGARAALVSACARARDFEAILKQGSAFHERFLALRGLQAKQWGRTTCYDLLVRTGQLKIGSSSAYEPDRAYLADSTGPRKGFQKIWGVEVTRSNSEACEALLRAWSDRWQMVADQVGVTWTDGAYGPGDFENALCVFQERGNPGYEMTT